MNKKELVLTKEQIERLKKYMLRKPMEEDDDWKPTPDEMDGWFGQD